jgi:hypothetical protein
MLPVDKTFIQLWIKALRSGRYQQGQGQLKLAGTNPRYCCLGVACEVLNGEDYLTDKSIANLGYPPKPLYDQLNNLLAPMNTGGELTKVLNDNIAQKTVVRVFAMLNDVRKWSFADFADLLERHLEKGTFDSPLETVETPA